VLNFYAGAPERLHGQQIPVAGGVDMTFHEPLGVVGIIVPWNFPLHLSLIPLTYAFAAGNRAMIKMATNSQHLCRLLAEKFGAVFISDDAKEGIGAYVDKRKPNFRGK
jgi:acyl-CoA reductase-like NAD-dependent aldehyde dehydrogenase